MRRRLSILCGQLRASSSPSELARGADGAMTGYRFPRDAGGCGAGSMRRGDDRSEAHDLFDAHLPLVRYEQQPGIGLAVRKHVLAKRGVIASAAQRRPGAALGAEALADVERLLARQARKLAAFA